MSNSDFGLIGLAVMGQNLVLNVESRGFQVSVYNRTVSVTDEFVGKHPDKKLVGAKSLEEFVQSLASPRKVMIMVKAGGPVDAVIESLIPLLDKGDIIIDGGNSLYTDTERRDQWLGDLGFRFIGAGVSGGEEGARKGPSIMPGGPASTWDVMKPIFESIAAKVDGEPCVTHIGPGGAGHYVKMIHNGIEYGDMQLICEAYNIFKAAGVTADELAEVFTEWNNGDLESYLIQITAEIFKQKDPGSEKALV
ncbi:MAG TPA: NAD(P)-binding domain-containing protein, partial [Luteolibacter sp.]